MCISKQHTGIIWTDLSLCKDNIRPDHVTDLLNTPRPGNVSEVRRLLGMTNHSSQNISNFATPTTPLCELTKKMLGLSATVLMNKVLKNSRLHWPHALA